MAAMAEQLRFLTQHITQAPGTMRAMPSSQPAAPVRDDAFDQIVSDANPINKGIRVIKWAAAIIVPIFLGGGAYATFKDDVAMKSDIADHIIMDLDPVRAQVTTIGHGVETLLSEKLHERKIQRLDRQLLKHQTKYEQLMADYRNARARSVWMKKPTKSDKQIDIESDLEDLLNTPVRGPITVTAAPAPKSRE